ncbi:acyl-CoA thioester hydrolase/BAAT C-terminal domain-containing protein [Gordonia insulae]|uniref:BAAT/Acyl-CoA thioester hydrolase C-terminal domain-containing protein n=1 Tax=Gordonia insulae TaxID=2420509 RepID=A0A3G8JNQ5_9ACTN|nr:acyl-CoA thioester hydrolase/BAAT C-terminal domain-containing protein [Gordonia insulae]AZG46275.1 hypothetical protein D7316_02876 [Gordonia insulae]
MKLHISSPSELIDSPVSFRVSDTEASSVVLVVRVTDAEGHPWQSIHDYQVGDDGVVEIPDPDEPWTSMEFVSEATAPVVFTGCETGLDFVITATAEREAASLTVRRSWGVGLVTDRIEGDGWVLACYRPAVTEGPLPGVIVVPGTLVSGATQATAALFASHGYAAGVLYYTQQPGLPDSVARIAVESIEAGMRSFAALLYVDSERVAVHAGSVGCQTALATLSGARDFRAKAVVLVAPSHVVFQALRNDGPPPKASALTRGAVDLPYVPVKAEKLFSQLIKNQVRRLFSRRPTSMAIATRTAYAAGLADGDAVEAAVIPVEEVDAPILGIAGDDDQSYPADEMVRAIMDRRSSAGVGAADELHVYTGAGHFIRPPATPTTVDRSDGLVAGGTPRGSAVAQRDAWNRTLAFLGTHLGG